MLETIAKDEKKRSGNQKDAQIAARRSFSHATCINHGYILGWGKISTSRTFFFFFSFLWWPPRTGNVTIENRFQNWWISKTHSLLCAKHRDVEGCSAKHRGILLDANALNQIPKTRDVKNQWSVSRNSRELFVPEKPVVKLQSSCFEKLIFLTRGLRSLVA